MNPFDPFYHGEPLFGIYNDPPPPNPRNSVHDLPSGHCNYIDMTPGANGAKCGCRRFWIRIAARSPIDEDGPHCMCNHHACYHDEGSGRATPMVETRSLGQENQAPRTSREPLSPMVDLSAQMPPPPATTGTDLPIYPLDDPLSFIYDNQEQPGPASNPTIPPTTTQQPIGSLPDTLPWTEPYQSPAPSHRPGYITSQGPLLSQATSTTSSVRAKYVRPFAGKGLDTLSSAAPPRGNTSPAQAGSVGPAPQRRNSDFADGSFVLVTQNHANGGDTTQTLEDTQPEPRTNTGDSVSRKSFKDLSDTVGGHEQRLERLETVSFSAVGHDDCHERHDHMDLRVTDLESRMEEVEKLGTEHGAAVARLADKNDDAATQSVASFSTADTSRPTHSQEIYSQLQSLQAQMDVLQSTIPTSAHPRELEVVFLPFPLKKVWQEIHQFKSEPASGNDDWTQLPMTYSSKTLRSQSPFYGDWASADHDAEWLLPRACGEKGLVDKRLRSRGLVKKVSVFGPDARSVHLAIHTAFGETWQEMQMPPASMSSDPRVARYAGLQCPWVPLRKIHKDSRLRFLSPAEMLNPTLWDVQFLTSVMMRSSEPRLFVTHPDAYLQDFQAYEAGWTWQKVRELTRVYPDVSDSQEVPEADALEEHWSWNEQFDEAPSAHTSMSLRNERQPTSMSSPSQHVPQEQFWRSSSPLPSAPGQPAVMRARRGSRPPHIRTTSVPLNASAHASPALSRRRVVSHGQSRRSSPSVRSTSQIAAVMKRRQTRSPSYPRHTPRWTMSPSPVPGGITDRQHVRGTTPFAYATPFSNAPLQEMRPGRAGSAAPIPPEYMSDMMHEPDELYEIEIYESDSDGSYVDDDGDTAEIVTHAQVHAGSESQPRQLPEDEPWPGIEDQEQLSDGENIDPRDADRRSNASSQPSEYPSTQRAWPDDTSGVGFQIHEDG